ncbi:c-type cytochrome [Pseudoneobacillus rhizosphaerae]|uniref:Cbb3-type cytochrome c oxidase subunit CcoP2 n=1 Tax=Pseudoneobacillus rhizosphaerae TaxID=2880968 RepID=A0A9C7GBB2_9BACI|nr:c-type cytochrome [Pseudoneobacillus rhizosphaerae]CAG9609329.1 Cbb3-type cytochrome c oxidase subunit CcoP2 [Pseudoneobacillus rhizosphaerae]
MKKILIGIYILVTLGIIFLLIQLNPKEKKDLVAIEAGEKLYMQMCSSCHGNSGLGEGAKQGTALNNQQFLSTVSNQDLIHYVKYGREGTIMPDYKFLSDEQLNQLVAFMRDWQTEKIHFDAPETISGDIDNGEKVYGLYCLSCHGVDGVGKKKMGTALSNPQYLKYTTDQQIWISTAYGRDKTRMSASLEGLEGVRQLSKDEITDVISFIRSFEKK